MNLKIRELEKKDISIILSLLQKMYLEHDLKESDLFDPNSFSKKEIEKCLHNSLSSKNEKTFVAIIDNIIAGTIRVEIKIPPSFYKDKKIAYLDDLVVEEKYRKKGVASKLIEHAVNFAKNIKVTLFESKIYEFNHPSKKLMTSLGFKKTFSYFYKRI